MTAGQSGHAFSRRRHDTRRGWLSADVDVGPAVPIRFRTPDDLPGNGCDLSHAEEQKRSRFAAGLPSVHSKYMCGKR